MDDGKAISALGQALRRIVATITAMAGFGEEQTLLRRQRNTILRLLRPAESATRRLIVAMARGLAVHLRQPSPARPRRLGPKPQTRRWPLVLSLLDPQRHRQRRRWVRRTSVPRIMHLGLAAALPLVCRPLPLPDDVLDAAGLNARLAALNGALADMEGRARAFARWQARQAVAANALGAIAAGEPAPARLLRRALRRPLRIGRAPGNSRRSPHEIHTLLAQTHTLALDALAPP
ncbi:hypothetical protein ACFOEZ_16095 [Tianweitania populi]|uniref:Uncharacterized protein n=1 Tax=Tianweitania populi TaxID=1607949 RepID=A0A8J3DS00_9HYPH|nr:hypothetical protein [Tianweitania populi]GHD15578.1 hypothetical protein GCM10016234_22660 [Tianweitania populi]